MESTHTNSMTDSHKPWCPASQPCNCGAREEEIERAVFEAEKINDDAFVAGLQQGREEEREKLVEMVRKDVEKGFEPKTILKGVELYAKFPDWPHA